MNNKMLIIYIMITMNKYTVTELNNVLKKTLQTNFKNNIVVTGEISNLRVSGKNTYLTLKDDSASISIIFWSHLDNKHGDNVEITGKIDYYIISGKISIIGNQIKIIGSGALHAEYENIKQKYEKKGYFNNKKALPEAIKKIGIITSSTGAALQDILYVLQKNEYAGEICIYDCIVQGPKCAPSVVAGIKYFNNIDDVEIVLITRGGGSFEDLMGFSHSNVINAIYKSNKYTISAVGHEIDNMLSDYVANYRAPTPSIAGEVICSLNINDKKRIIQIENELNIIKNETIKKLYEFKRNIKHIMNNVIDPTKQMHTYVDNIYTESTQHIKNILINYKQRIINIKEKLNTNDVNKLMENGFIIMLNNGVIIKNVDELFNNTITLIHHTGSYNVIINKN